MTRRTFYTLAGTILLPSQRLWAQDAKSILTKATDTYQALKSYRFEGKTISETTIKDKTSRSELGFDVAFEAPDKFRLEFLYPSAGNWLRVSDGKFMRESRSLAKESRRVTANDRTMRVLNSSPIYNFERLSKTAEKATLVRSEAVEVAGKRIDCDVIQFASGRRQLRKGESPGASMVWVAKDSGLVLREEIRTSASVGGEKSDSRRITTIEKFQVNEGLSPEVFSTAEVK